MSTLTKICVVVLVVLVIFACAIFIQYAVTVDNYKQAHLNEQARRKLADAKARNEELAAGVWRDLYQEEKRKGEGSTAQFQTEIGQKDAQNARLSQLLAEREATIKELTAIKTGMQNALNESLSLNKAQKKELDDQRSANIQLSDQLRGAQAKIDEYESKIELLNRTHRVLQEQIAEREQENKDLRAENQRLKEATAPVAKTPPVTGPKVEASITAVRGDIASLNVGSASAVKKGLEFIIYRGSEFVAHLQIEFVDTTTCSGIFVQANSEEKVGDKATTSLELD